MSVLDSPEQFKKIDPSSILQNINELPDQIAIVWQEMKKFALPAHYIQCNKVVLTGMGGSAQGAGLNKTLADPSTKMPIEVVRDYRLPGYLDSKTLMIAVSYSGNTEETLSTVQQALRANCKLIAIASGGQLETLAKKHHFPCYKINYGSQPRAALGYSYTAILAIFNKLGLLEVSDDDITKAVSQMKAAMKKIGPQITVTQNPAKQLAERLPGKIPVIIGAGIMQEVARRYKGQFNENSKTASYFEILPEMNHSSLVGTEFPGKLAEKIFIILLTSQFDHPRNQKRSEITQKIWEKRRLVFEVIQPTPAANKVAEQLLAIHFGDYVSYYLAILEKRDPESVEVIDFLKQSLAKVK